MQILRKLRSTTLASLLACSIATVTCLWAPATLSAQSIPVPDNTKFVLTFDVQALKGTKIGSKLIEAIETSVKKEIESASNSDSSADAMTLEKVSQILGMDPFEEVRGISLSSSNLEHPETGMLIQFRLNNNAGNIEGLLVNIPGYESSEHGSHTIHSATPDSSTKVYGCLHKADDGKFTFLLASDKEILTSVLDRAKNPKVSANGSLLDDDKNTFLSLHVIEFPKLDLGEGPQANIAKMLTGLNLAVSEKNDNIELRSTLLTATQKKATQLHQAIQGLIAMVELFASMDEGNEEVRELIAQVKKVRVSHEDTRVEVQWSVPTQQVSDMIDQELKEKNK